ncbi:hypothetical protein B0H67DRAFT_687755 [Lasiosphaeris hirsuta]|uniref:Uncharacterized protein n=1 Tax=Lasiosphaeris hirsuta TaxID=260670 RepID=A0AA39ZXU8_9PEZI|nr:hypothetical protein B0H67DRAFT_687755 [Lasiosphaeris hirsuta]
MSDAHPQGDLFDMAKEGTKGPPPSPNRLRQAEPDLLPPAARPEEEEDLDSATLHQAADNATASTGYVETISAGAGELPDDISREKRGKMPWKYSRLKKREDPEETRAPARMWRPTEEDRDGWKKWKFPIRVSEITPSRVKAGQPFRVVAEFTPGPFGFYRWHLSAQICPVDSKQWDANTGKPLRRSEEVKASGSYMEGGERSRAPGGLATVKFDLKAPDSGGCYKIEVFGWARNRASFADWEFLVTDNNPDSPADRDIFMIFDY